VLDNAAIADKRHYYDINAFVDAYRDVTATREGYQQVHGDSALGLRRERDRSPFAVDWAAPAPGCPVRQRWRPPRPTVRRPVRHPSRP